MKKFTVLLIGLFSALWFASTADAAIIVGRISHVEGEIYRYMEVDNSWVETSLRSPAGSHDVLAAGDDSRAEIRFPDNRMVMLDQGAEIEILNLEEEISEFALYYGTARFYNWSRSGRLLVETDRGTAIVGPGSAADIETDGRTVTVASVEGETAFRTTSNGAEKVEVISGNTSLEFRKNRIIAGIGPISRKWDRWCADREEHWDRNRLVRSRHLPDSMQEYAYVLEPNGRWQRVYYRGYYYWAWKPYHLSAGWSPYTTGYWYDWHGTEVWLDHNPWGWVTHHHGHWIKHRRGWMWTPYIHVSHVPGVTVLGFSITFGNNYRPYWHPGRVRWIAHHDHVGWLPLAPWETYYGYRKWGPRTVVVNSGVNLNININLSGHRHIDHAMIIPKRHLRHRRAGVVNSYNTVRIKNVNKTIIVNNYKPLATSERIVDRKRQAKRAEVRKSPRRFEGRRPAGKMERAHRNVHNSDQERKREKTIFFERKKREREAAPGFVGNLREELTGKKRPMSKDMKRAENRGRKNRAETDAGRETFREKKESRQKKSLAAETRSGKKELERSVRKLEKVRKERQAAVARVERIRKKESEVRSRKPGDRQQAHIVPGREERKAARQAERAERKLQREGRRSREDYRKKDGSEEQTRDENRSRIQWNDDKKQRGRWSSVFLNERRSR